MTSRIMLTFTLKTQKSVKSRSGTEQYLQVHPQDQEYVKFHSQAEKYVKVHSSD